MKKLSIFKIKVCICELVLISILAVTSVFVFAVGPTADDHKIADLKTVESSSVVESSKKDVLSKKETSDSIPVVVLDDGKKAQVVSLSDFLKLAQNPKIDAVVPADQVKNMIDLVRLQNEIKASDASTELLKKLDKIAEKMDKNPTDGNPKQDPWYKEGWKEAIKMPKDFIRSIGVSAVKYIVGGTICGIIVIGGAVLTYKYVVLPTWCWSGVPGALKYFSSWGAPIKAPLYEVCNSYWDSSIPLNVQVVNASVSTLSNVSDCDCDADFLSRQCFNDCFKK